MRLLHGMLRSGVGDGVREAVGKGDGAIVGRSVAVGGAVASGGGVVGGKPVATTGGRGWGVMVADSSASVTMAVLGVAVGEQPPTENATTSRQNRPNHRRGWAGIVMD